MKKIFHNVIDSIKLNILLYNKALQSKLNIDIIDIQRYNGKYILGERNGKGKEYFDDNIIFEGEYLNGKRHGKRKEYD